DVVLAAQLDAAAIEVDETGRVLLRLVELDEVVDRPRAVGLELERALVGVGRALLVVEHVATGLADAAPEARAVLVVVRQVGAADEDADERRPVREERGERVHLLERTRVGLVLLEDALPGGERAARVVATLVVELRERLEELTPPDALDLLDPDLVRLREV